MKLSIDGRLRQIVHVAFATAAVIAAVPASAQEAAPAPVALDAGSAAAVEATLPVAALPAEAQVEIKTEKAVKLQKIEVTGSRIKRIDAEGSLPVETVTKQQIERAGYQSTEQLLTSLSSVSTIGGTQLSEGAGNSTFGVATVSLRGLGDDRTLVLVNGRRLAAQAGGGGTSVNVNTIPLSAIERVEVLKDGASSTYGSDAVAGVVNFILKKDYQGLEVAGTYGTPTRDGGGQNGRFSLTGGYGDLDKDRFNFTGSVSFEKEKALFGRDRNFARSGNVDPFIVSGATGQGNIEGAYTPGDGRPYTAQQEAARRQPGFGNSPATGFGNPLADQDRCGDIRMFLNPTPTTKGAPFCAYDSAPDVGLVPKRQLLNGTGNFTFKLTENHELFADALYGESEVTQAFQPSPLRASFLRTDTLFRTQGVDSALLLRPANPNYQTAATYLNANGFGNLVGQTLAVTARVFDFGPRTSKDKSQQQRFTLGSRGTLIGSHDYEIALMRNESKLKGSVVDGYFSQVKYVGVINQPDSDYNPFSLQQSNTFNQRVLASGAEYIGPTLNAKSTANVGEVLFTGDLAALPAGQLQYAVGGQYRKEDYANTPSEALGLGDIAGLGGSVPPVDKTRKVNSVYGELSLPIFKDLPYAKSVDASLGLRRDDYTRVGESVTYKANLGWRPDDTTLLRGSTGTGFRAPSLEELFQPQSLGTSEQFDDPATGQTDLQVNALSGGNPDLKPEQSQQSSLGIVWQPVTEFSASLDYWKVKIKDAISVPSAQLVVSRFRAGDPTYANSVTLSGNDIDTISTTLQNTGALDIAGWDLGLGYRKRLGPGRLEISLNATYLDKFNETTPSGEISDKVGTTVDITGAPVSGAENGGVALEYKHVLSATWTQSNFGLTLAQNFYKGYEMGHDLNDQRRFIPSVSVYDATVSYKGLIKGAKVGLGVKNIFDTDPPLYIPVSNQFQAGYDTSLEDPRRRFVFVTASYEIF